METLRISPRAENGAVRSRTIKETTMVTSGAKAVGSKPARSVKSAPASTVGTSRSGAVSGRAAVKTASKQVSPQAESDKIKPLQSPILILRKSMDTLNNGLRDLTLAMNQGYRYPRKSPTSSRLTASPSAQPSAYKGKEKDPDCGNEAAQWTDERMISIVDSCDAAATSLRQLVDQGQLASKTLEIERACTGLVSRCMYIGMVSGNGIG
jgi:hypothetical protein